MCMALACNPQMNCCHFFAVRIYSFLDLMYLDTGYLATPPTVLAGSF